MLDRTIDVEPPVATALSDMDIAAYLIEVGLLDTLGQARAETLARDGAQNIATALVQLGLISERALADAYANCLGLAIIRPADYPPEPVLPHLLKARFLRAARVIPLRLHDNMLDVAMADPADSFTKGAIQAATGLIVQPVIAVPIELDTAFARLYPQIDQSGGTDESEGEPIEADAERLKDMASEAPVIKLVNQIMARAVETRASDIHIEPGEDRLRIRYRYDGALVEADTQPASLAPAIISRIKIMAKLDIAERRLPQDGRIKLAVRGHEVDFRVSSIPALHGETVALRILDRSAVQFEFSSLGLDQSVIAALRRGLAAPNGIILVTGPTGSGKTTTLYTALLALNDDTRKIVTIEDPVEYQLRGINQSQVKPQIGLDFAQLLRAILRQDPNVIMVGEIRDLETAQIAARAALTGHLVLSTLHTNSTAATMTRLRDMGLEPYLIGSVLRGVLAQRLVRRLCTACKTAVTDKNVASRFGLSPETILYRPTGCPDCRQSGYRGRRAIAEFMVPTPAIAALLAHGASEAEIEQAATKAGMRSMLEAGLDLVRAGETTIDDVLRVVQEH